jgi:hypothetical protein
MNILLWGLQILPVARPLSFLNQLIAWSRAWQPISS